MSTKIQPFLLLLLLLTSSLASPDLSSERSALLALRSSLSGRTLLWSTNQTSPCNWAGVICSNSHVTSLRLPAASLSGQIPLGIFSNLTHLRALSLRFNGLSGPLPSDLGLLVNLRNLYLQNNNLTGQIPNSLVNLVNLVRLNLAGNWFSGEISPELGKLRRLRTLFLERNEFEGSLPDLELPKLEQFNVSDNMLNGSVPLSLRAMPVNAFIGNVGMCGKPLEKACEADNPIAINGVDGGRKSRKKLSGGAIAGIVIGAVLGLLLVLVILLVLCRRKNRRGTRAVDIATVKHLELGAQDEKMPESRNGGGGGVSNGGGGYSVAEAAVAALTVSNVKSVEGVVGGGGGNVEAVKKLVFFGNGGRVFDLEDLLRASAEVLGKGTFGTAYKAVMDTGVMVAVKRLKDVIITEREFREKIEVVGAMDNENLVPLRAYYYSRDEKLLVYDYMPMGSLSALLHGEPFSSTHCFS